MGVRAMNKKIYTIIFWGAAWGLFEATLGYVLHMFSLSIGWLFWFPLAFFFMDNVYKRTRDPGSVLWISFIASSIKLIDFLLPASIDRIINPAVSILLEGLIVFAVIKITEFKKDFFRFKYIEAFSASIGWRMLYIIYILFMPSFFYNISPLREPDLFLRFFVSESIINSIIIYAYIKFSDRINGRDKEQDIKKTGRFDRAVSFIKTNTAFNAALSLSLMALAIYVQWVL
jgi:hypothetical protein